MVSNLEDMHRGTASRTWNSRKTDDDNYPEASFAHQSCHTSIEHGLALDSAQAKKVSECVCHETKISNLQTYCAAFSEKKYCNEDFSRVMVSVGHDLALTLNIT